MTQLVKNLPWNAGDLGSIPGLGRSPEEGKSYPLQYSGLENSTDCYRLWGCRVGHDWVTFTFTSVSAKLITWTTALPNSMKLWAMPCRASQADRSWWRVLTKHGPLEKSLANYFSTLENLDKQYKKVSPIFSNLSLNVAIWSSWYEPQSALSLVFADSRVSPSLAAKNIINLISVLTIWWCPCVESSLVLLEEGAC